MTKFDKYLGTNEILQVLLLEGANKLKFKTLLQQAQFYWWKPKQAHGRRQSSPWRKKNGTMVF